MTQEQLLTSLAARLMEATCFEDAATAALTAALTCAEAAIESGPHGAPGRVLRGVVHVRPADSYQRLFCLEHPSGARASGTGYLTSANIWRWVAEHRCPVSIDVQLSTLHAWLPEGQSADHKLPASSGLPGRGTRDRMIGRETTHVHVVPLPSPGGGVGGMITLEASFREAAGQTSLWRACHEQLQVLAFIAGPHLCSLPLREPAAVSADALLPVVGPSVAGLIDLLRVFARQEETILIGGPTGVGKSRLARWCHAQSPRGEHRFETIDLMSVPQDLQMAELFGWRRGAFTGAVRDSRGAIGRAAHGTLFIDEIDKLSMNAQSGLLRVLEERRYHPFGDDSSERRADVRFIVGTNADLRAAVRAGRFREDLYYRINVLPVRLPALAERLDELPAWADYMLGRRHAEAGAGEEARFSAEAVQVLLETPWPGNLRQLDNIIRRAYVIALADRSHPGTIVLERRHVERALAYEEGGAAAGAVAAHLWRAALAFVGEAARREGGAAAALSLDLADAFRGMVLGAAVRRKGNRDDAFSMLGQQPLLKNRNHHRAYRRELDRVRDLLRALDGDVDAELKDLLDAADDAGD
jgi:DNA-binding NtrC family response regulator